MLAFRVCVVVLALAAVARADDPKAESWKGQLIVGKKPDKEIKFGDVIDGKQVYFEFRSVYPLKVRDERDGWLRLFDGHREGWADKADFLLTRDATAYYTDRIRAKPDDTFAWQMRGLAWRYVGEYDNAIKDFTESIRLDPKDAAAFNGRGITWRAKKEYDAAIKDYSEAIRLQPQHSHAHYNRSTIYFILRRQEATTGFQTLVELESGVGKSAAFAVIRGHLSARRHGDDAAAKRFLGESAAKLSQDWPFPAVRFLRGDIDEAALLKAATDDDKRTEARCYLGLDHLLKGRTDESAAHFRWVKEHGTKTFTEYAVAVAELERLEKAKK